MGASGTHAVVLGASMAGLTIAQALGQRYDRVTVVERDHLGDRAEPRRGVPQSRHVHVLQLRGKDALEELFPGLGDDLITNGAVASDSGERGRITMSGHRFVRQALGRDIVSASRPLLEQHVRRRVRANPRVDLAGGCDALRPVTTADRRRVTGVAVRERAEEARSGRCPPTSSSPAPGAARGYRGGWRSSGTRRRPSTGSSSACGTRAATTDCRHGRSGTTRRSSSTPHRRCRAAE